jgi:hypothetical protein
VCTREQTPLIAGFIMVSDREGRKSPTMRFIHLFLVGYFILVLGIGLALWQTGLLSHVAPIWIGIGALAAIGVGIMLSVSSGKPTISEETHP